LRSSDGPSQGRMQGEDQKRLLAHSSSTIETMEASGEEVSPVSLPISTQKLAEGAARKSDRRHQSTCETTAANLHTRDMQEAGKGDRFAVQDARTKTRAPFQGQHAQNTPLNTLP